MDVDETDTDLVVKAEIPGMDATQIDVSISSGTLTIKGEKKEEREEKEEGRHSIERSFGSFSRSFRLPFPVDEDNIKASYKHGVLTVTLPKIEPAVKKSIQVES
jgi:HSP20 family protein